MNIDHKRKLAAFYTPQQVTNVLSDWAIRSPDDRVLEPSFGGCNFLISSIDCLSKLGSKVPTNHILGFDIDPNAFTHLQSKGITGGKFLLEDFLLSNYYSSNAKVSTILGNPPYLPIHKLESKYKFQIYAAFKNNIFKIPKRSSLWVYFIIQSLQYLENGGRMAWIVPSSISFTGYGSKFLNFLSEKFTFIKLIQIEERFFDITGTEEKTSILICEGYKLGTTEIQKIDCETLADGLNEVFITRRKIKKPKAENLKEKLNPNFKKVTLGALCDIKIGIVIGATKLLTYSVNQAQTCPYSKYLYPIITKGRQLNTLAIAPDILLREKNSPVYLVDAVRLEKEDPLLFSNFINNIPSTVLMNDTFSNRRNLFEYDDYRHPDGFLTFYSQKLPRVIVNHDKQLNCTNSVHRLYLNPEYKGNCWLIKFVALQLYSMIYASETLSMARQYGNRIKKYEPSDAANIPVIIPREFTVGFGNQIELLFDSTSLQIALGKSEEAKLLLESFFGKYIFDDQKTGLFVA